MKKLLLPLILALMPQQAHADEHLVGLVTRIYVNDGAVNFILAQGCKNITNYKYWQFSLASDTGKAWYAMLLSAATTKMPIRIAYPGACDPTVHQSVSYIYQDF